MMMMLSTVYTYIHTHTQMMKDVIRRSPGFADMRVALAAHYWSIGDLGV